MLPSICVGIFGPRRAGKSTLLKALLDNESDPTSEATVETRALRFAHAEIHKCNGDSSSSSNYRSFGNMLLDEDDSHETVDDDEIISRRAISFVDCPGHMGSIPTMLKGMMMSDAVLILSRPNKAASSFSDPPTLEVLAAADLMGKTILVVQSRADDASEKQLEKHRAQIQRFTHDMIHKHVPIVEARAADMRSLCRYLADMRVTVMERSTLAEALLLVGASCVVDGGGPATEEEEEAAAAADAAGDETIFVTIYGRLVQGTVSPGDEVEVRPGVTVPIDDGRRVVCHPIILKVSSVVQQPSSRQAAAGGGVLLALRATATVVAAGRDGDGMQQQLVRRVLAGDGGLEGHVLGHVGSLPGVYVALQMKFWLLSNMFDPYAEEVRRVKAIEMNEELLLIIGTMSTYGKVRRIEEKAEEDDAGGGGESSSRDDHGGAAKAKAKGKKQQQKKKIVMVMVVGGLTPPTCARPGENILICRRLGSALAWHLIGRGQIIGGAPAAVSYI